MKPLFHDLGVAARALRRRPTLVAAVALVSGLGIGATTAIGNAVVAVFLSPPPVAAPERLMELYSSSEHDATGGGGLLGALAPSSYPNFEDLRRRAGSFTDLAAHQFLQLGIAGDGEPEEVTGEIVSPSYFRLLGVTPLLGPGFAPEREAPGTQPAVVLSYGLWQRRFDGDPRVVGRKLVVNGQPLTITGVAPAGFSGLNVLFGSELWVPISEWDGIAPAAWRAFKEHRRGLFFGIVGRLRPGVTMDQARAELSALGERLASEHPDWNRGRGATALPVREAAIPPNLRPQFVAGARLLTAASLVVLLVAGVNVASLMLSHATTRRREMAIRLSLGAGRRHLARQLGLESLLLAGAGGLLGVGLAWAGGRALLALRPPFLEDAVLELGLGPWMLALAALLTVITALLFGLVPALSAARPDLMGSLRTRLPEPGRGLWADPRRLLVAAQVALSLVALVGALLFLRNLDGMRRLDPGFDPSRLVIATLNPELHGIAGDRQRAIERRLVEGLAGLPGVERVALAENPPLAFGLLRRVLLPGMTPDQGVLVATNTVDDAYFETLGLRLLAGRGFSGADRAGAPRVTVINRHMARSLWPGEEAVGQELSFSGEEAPLRVVGVIEDARYFALNEETQPYAYLPLAQRGASTLNVHLRVAVPPATVLAEVRQRLGGLVPELPLAELAPGAGALSEALWAPRAGASLLGLFGLLAVLLAMIGLYGVLASFVSRQRREIGVRLALGAPRANVTGMVLGRGLRPVAGGLLLGLPLALWATRKAAGLLFQLEPFDPPSFAGAVALLGLVALAACWLPARRAARVDPLVALQGD